MPYEFNPHIGANHTKRRFLGQPGSSGSLLGNDTEDPKYKGPCGQQYQYYRSCLRVNEFNRDQCRNRQLELIECQKQKLADQSAQFEILKNWRANKHMPVRDSYIPLKFFDTEPEVLRSK